MTIKPEIWRNYNHIYWHIGRFEGKSLGLDIGWGGEVDYDEIEMHLHLFLIILINSFVQIYKKNTYGFSSR